MSTSESSVGSPPIEDSETERAFEAIRRARTETRQPRPFEKHWEGRHAPADGGFVVKSNAYERALLKYVAMVTGETVHGLVRRLATEQALKIAMGVG